MALGIFLSLFVVTVPRATGQCRDDDLCDYWTGGHRCLLSPSFMVSRCPLACENPCKCDLRSKTKDTACNCVEEAKKGYCDTPGAFDDCFTTCTLKTTVNCPTLPKPRDPNGRLSTTETSYLSDVFEECRVGLEPANPINTGRKLCIANGTWISDSTVGRSIECKVVKCDKPPTVANADSQALNTLYGHNATYKCETDFDHVSGQLNLTCGPSGAWEGNPVVCKYVNCGDAPQREGTDVISTNGSSYNAVAMYNCTVGWEYSKGDEMIVCSEDSEWVGNLLTCTRVDCGDPSVLDKSDKSADTLTTFEAQFTFTCHLGHERVGGDIKRQCQANKTWSGTALVCSPVACTDLPVFTGARSWTLEGGIIDVDNPGPFLYKTKVFHECFYQDDKAIQWIQKCGANKKWIGDEPKCGANSDFQRKAFEPEPEEAPGSWAVGLTIFAVIVFIIVIFIIMDMDTMRRHSKYMKANLRNFRRMLAKRWKQLRTFIQLKTTSMGDHVIKTVKEADMSTDYTTDEVQDFPGDSDNGSEFNFSTGSASMPSTPRTVTSFV